MKNQIMYPHKQSPLRINLSNENTSVRNNVQGQNISGNKTFYQQNLIRNSSAIQNIIDSTSNYSFSKLNTRNISPNPASENQGLRSKQSFGSDLKLQQIQFNYASPSQEQLRDGKDKDQSRAISAGRNNIRARYLIQNQKQQGGNAGVNASNLSNSLLNSQVLVNQLQSSKNEEDIMNMKKSQSYRIKQNLNSQAKSIIEALGKSQIQQQTSTKNANNINYSDADDQNQTSNGIFVKKQRNSSQGGGNTPYRNKINSNSGNSGGALIDNVQKRSSSQSYHMINNLNNTSVSTSAPNNGSANASNNNSYIGNINQIQKNSDHNNNSFVEMNIDNLNNLTESQIRQTRINNLKNYISTNYNNNLRNEEISKISPKILTQTQVIQENKITSQKNTTVNKHITNYGNYSSQQDKTQPLKALHSFIDSDIQVSTQKNTQEISSGRQTKEKEIESTNSQGKKKININEKKNFSLDDQQTSNYLQNINNSLNYLKIAGQTNSTNASTLPSQQISEKDANIEEMHFYAVEFQQNCKKWLSHIEDKKI